MTDAERWKKIEDLYHAALECDVRGRAALLEKACAGDRGLRDEVESLLAFETREENFLAAPALDVAAALLAQDANTTDSAVLPDRFIGQTVSHYRVLEKLGRGGMGVVYKAVDTRLGRHVALKFLPDRVEQDEPALGRFKREARAASALNHPHICAIYDTGEYEGQPFIVMELMEGQTLKHRISGKPLPGELVVNLGIQIGGALGAAHSKGIIHRDVKPANIFVTDEGAVKLLDFGVAKLATNATEALTAENGVATTAREPARELTRTGVLIGTAAYMSPEQVRGEPLDARTDLFSFGAVLYEMATGHPAFSGDTGAQTRRSIVSTEPPPARKLNPRVPAGLERVITKSLMKERQNRFQQASEMCAELSRVRREMAGHPARRVAVATIGLALLLAGLTWKLKWLRPALSTGQVRSIAVLPLANLSGDPGQEYFADGMTEDLITELAKVGTLKIISHTSMMHYKGTKEALPQIGRELNVDAVVEGSVERSGDRVRITAQLIQAATDRSVWADSYEGDVRDVLTLQDEVARTIANQVKVRLTPQEQARLTSARTVNPEAYEAYLKGRYYWNQRSCAKLKKGLQFFDSARDKDPSWALAYVGIADSLMEMPLFCRLPAEPLVSQAHAAVVRALEVDDNLAEAHASLGFILRLYEWNWDGEAHELKQAIELNPNYSMAHAWYSLYLSSQRRHQEAIAEVNRAVELDPLVPIISTSKAVVLFNAHRYQEVVDWCQRAIDFDPTFPHFHFFRGAAYVEMGLFERGLKELQTANRLEQESAVEPAGLGYAYARAGKRDEALKILAQLKQSSKRSYVSSFYLGLVYAGLGQKNEALTSLEKAADERSTEFILWMNTLPWFDSLHSDPRFQTLLRRIGLPPTNSYLKP